ncbi:MAG: outer membrane protein assembly factor BamA [Nitrospirae bacterium]|nr:outer membrane protein assembly factor BamA [Nitrospirota bacterium]
MKRCLFTLVLFIACYIPCVANASDSAETYMPKELAISGLHSMSQEDFLNALGLNAGSSVTAEQLRNGIKRVFQTGYFEDIIIKKMDSTGSRIEITAVEQKIISSIKISGNENFSDSFYIRALSLEKGIQLNSKEIDSAAPKLLRRLHNKGYRKAKISWTANELKYPYVEIAVNVFEGEPEIVKKLVLQGPEEEMNYYLNIFEGDIFDMIMMEQTKRKILDDYKKIGHIGVDFSYAYDSELLTAKLDPGRELKIDLHNNNNISSSRIMDELIFYERNEFSFDLLEESINRLTTFYADNGYIKAIITPVVTYSSSKINLDLYIFEGSIYNFGSIKFSGSSIDEKRLYEILGVKPGDVYRRGVVDGAAETLKDFYRSLGYLYADVDEPLIIENSDTRTADVEFNLKEGVQVTISKIDIANAKAFTPENIKTRLSIKPGSQYNEVDILDAKRVISDLYLKEGYFNAKVDISRDIKNGSATVVFNINEGNRLFFGKSIISGNGSTRPKVIKRELLHSEGMPADYSLILTERQNLYRLGLFSDIDTKLIDSGDGRKDVLYKLKEGNQGFVEFGAGYGEYEKARGFAEVGYRNLWGLNKQATLRTEFSTIEQRAIITFTEPWFLNSRMPLKMLLLHENREEKNIDTDETRYKLRRETATVGIEKKLSNNITSELYYDLSVVKTTEVQPDVVLSREDTGSLLISGLRAGIIYDKRDNPFEPSKGYIAGVTAKWATGMLFSETDFFKFSAYLNNFVSISKRVVLAISGRVGYGKGIGETKELPLVERFFLGGRTTVRGYEQDMLGPKGSNNNPTGGNAFAMANIELRTDVGKGIGVVTFFDAGDVWYSISDASMSELKFSSGLGLRYKTPVGPIRIDYGVKLNKRESMSRGELHFSIGHAF